MTTQDIALETGRPYGTVRHYIHGAYEKLGISSKNALVPYFPIEPDHPLLNGKKLMDLESAPKQLEILEALSLGQDYKTIAETHQVSDSTARTHVNRIGETWTDAKGAVTSARVANGIRARYIPIIESNADLEQLAIEELTLTTIAELEPIIYNSWLRNLVTSQSK